MSTCIRHRRNHDCPWCGLTPEQRERGGDEIAKHRQWVERAHRREPEPEELVCVTCGCGGNQECGHEPLDVPNHYCELDIGDQHESCVCYCCRISLGIQRKAAEAAGGE